MHASLDRPIGTLDAGPVPSPLRGLTLLFAVTLVSSALLSSAFAAPQAPAATALVSSEGSPHLFLDSIGRATVAGAVRAHADVERVGVRVALRDRTGKTLTTLDIATLLRRVPRGAVAGYRFQTDGMSGTGYWPTATRAVVVALSAAPASGPVDQGYRVHLDRPVTALGVQELDGVVSGHAGADLLVALVFRNAAGQVVDAGLAYPRGGRTIRQGGSAPFTLRRYVDGDSRQPSWASVTATAEGDGSGLTVATPRTTAAAPSLQHRAATRATALPTSEPGATARAAAGLALPADRTAEPSVARVHDVSRRHDALPALPVALAAALLAAAVAMTIREARR